MRPKQLLSIAALSLILLSAGHSLLAQTRVVAGKVIDSKDGAALPGISIVPNGTSIGTQTDSTGNFRISVPSSVTNLRISAIGYQAQDVSIIGMTFIEVALTATYTSLNDVVVIGYGTAKKKDLTGAIGSVVERDFNKGIYSSPDQLIQGKVTGVQMTTANGDPGSAITIKIRGSSALSGTGQPLFVIDGVQLDGRAFQERDNPLNFINPNDIASIDILKDASATAIYGSRAAYGVFIINTKSGQAGAPKLDVSVSAGISSILKKVDVLNPAEYRDAISYYNANPGNDKGSNINPFDAILQDAWQQNYSLAYGGGNENNKYRFSVGYQNKDGIVKNTNFKRYNAGMTASTKLLSSRKLGLDFNLNGSQYVRDGSGVFINDDLTNGNDNVIRTALQWNPTDDLYNADGSIKIIPNGPQNPLSQLNNIRANLKVTTLLASITPSYKFTSWLEYKLLLSVNYSTGTLRSEVNQATFPGFPGLASIRNFELTTEQVTHTLNFNKKIFPKLNLNALAGYEYLKFTSKGYGLSGIGVGGVGFGDYGLDYTNYVQYSDAGSRGISSYLDPSSELQSFFARAIFNYDEKYLLTATFRADGSTKFGDENKYGYFPSFALAWNIAKETFFNVRWVDALKIRGGWGKTGNQEFPPGSAQALYAFRNNGNVGQINNPNPNLKWQSDQQFDLGVDFSLFDHRLSGTIDYFNKKTTNLLFPSPPIQPAPPGSTVRWINLDGEIINKGFEFAVSGGIIRNEKFNWDLTVNTTFLNNSVSGLPVPIYTGFVNGPVETIQNGLPMNAFYTRKFLGLDKASGFSVYQDDGTKMYYVGDPNPKMLLGISSTFRYKKLSLIANMNGSFGQDIYNATLMTSLGVGGIQGGSNIASSVYHDPVKENYANPVTPSSRYVQNGDYFKLNNLTLSYELGNVANTFKNMVIYLTGQNLFMITSYQGFDPEVNINNSINGIPSLGIDNVRYPSSKSIIVGINFSL